MKCTLSFLLIFIWASNLNAQYKEPAWYPFSVNFSAGPNYYINNLEIYDNEINSWNFSTYAAFKWVSKYRISAGFRTGFVQFYHSGNYPTVDNLSISKKAVPIMAMFEMKIYRGFYASVDVGFSVIIINSSDPDSRFSSAHLSTADVSASLGYRWFLSDRWTLGFEGRFYRSAKSADMNVALPIEFGYRF